MTELTPANRYPVEELGDWDDDGTMPANVETLAETVVGHKIVSAEQSGSIHLPDRWYGSGLILTLDNGDRVVVRDDGDCCAFTEVRNFLLHPELVNHFIAGVGATDGYTKWHIYADAGDILELQVAWSAGNPFYYGYGFDISVIPLEKWIEASES